MFFLPECRAAGDWHTFKLPIDLDCSFYLFQIVRSLDRVVSFIEFFSFELWVAAYITSCIIQSFVDLIGYESTVLLLLCQRPNYCVM